MCPSRPVSRPRDIDFHAGDPEMIMHLERLTDGDPAPSNVITDVNPSTVAPWDLPENMLYFNLKEEPKSRGEQKKIKIIEGGYWQLTGQSTIIPTSSIVGTKTTLQFFIGQAPHGDETEWAMHKYEMKQRGSSSLCRVFISVNQSQNYVGSHGQAGARAADLLDSMLMDILESKENNQNKHGPSNNSQVVGRSDHWQPRVSSNHLHNLRPDHRPHSEGHNFSIEGYLGMSDLASSSSVSENTFIASLTSDDHFDHIDLLRQLDAENIPNTGQQNSDFMDPDDCFDSVDLLRQLDAENIPNTGQKNSDFMDSDDCFDSVDLLQQLESENMNNTEEQHSDLFDPEALLDELETENLPNIEQQHSDCRLNVAACKGSKQVVIQPPPSGSLHSNSNIKNKKTEVSALAPQNLSVPNAALHCSYKPQPNLKQQARTYEVNKANQGPSTLQGSTSNNVEQGRMTSGSLRSGDNLKNKENKVSTFAPKKSVLNASHHTSHEPQPNRMVPKPQPNRMVPKQQRSMYEVNGANQGPSTLRGRTSNNAAGERKTGGRIGKFVRKFFCFLPI